MECLSAKSHFLTLTVKDGCDCHIQATLLQTLLDMSALGMILRDHNHALHIQFLVKYQLSYNIRLKRKSRLTILFNYCLHDI